jgi:hypothetical protein
MGAMCRGYSGGMVEIKESAGSGIDDRGGGKSAFLEGIA